MAWAALTKILSNTWSISPETAATLGGWFQRQVHLRGVLDLIARDD